MQFAIFRTADNHQVTDWHDDNVQCVLEARTIGGIIKRTPEGWPLLKAGYEMRRKED